MGVIGSAMVGVVGLLVAVLAAALSRLLADDFKAWAPNLTERVIRCAVIGLPEDRRDRLGEEWRSHVNDTPGDLSKIVVAIGYLKAAWTISRAAKRGPMGCPPSLFAEVVVRKLTRDKLRQLDKDLRSAGFDIEGSAVVSNYIREKLDDRVIVQYGRYSLQRMVREIAHLQRDIHAAVYSAVDDLSHDAQEWASSHPIEDWGLTRDDMEKHLAARRRREALN